MNEETFHKFGTALDILEAVLYECNESDRKCVMPSFKDLDNFYKDIKAEYGYKDNQDKEDGHGKDILHQIDTKRD